MDDYSGEICNIVLLFRLSPRNPRLNEGGHLVVNARSKAKYPRNPIAPWYCSLGQGDSSLPASETHRSLPTNVGMTQEILSH